MYVELFNFGYDMARRIDGGDEFQFPEPVVPAAPVEVPPRAFMRWVRTPNPTDAPNAWDIQQPVSIPAAAIVAAGALVVIAAFIAARRKK